MKLLVSVADAEDARAAVAGGADVIDAKDPTRGALAPVRPETLQAIVAAVAGHRPVTAALGDMVADHALARQVAGFGLAFVKVGFPTSATAAAAESLAGAVVRDAAGCRVVLAAYADQGLDPWVVIEVATRVGATGVLLDTADKARPGLLDALDRRALGHWIASAREAGLTAAVAGRLSADDLPVVAELGADVAGVRGAACVGARAGRVSADRVRALVAAAQRPDTSASNAGESRTKV